MAYRLLNCRYPRPTCEVKWFTEVKSDRSRGREMDHVKFSKQDYTCYAVL